MFVGLGLLLCRILGELTNSSAVLLKVCPAHRDKAEIKCMGSVGGKTPTEDNFDVYVFC
jgi:hypothetical protein